MAKTLHPEAYIQMPNAWDYIKQHKNGKLKGMLTDALARDILPSTGHTTQSSRMTVAEAIGAHRTYHRPKKKN